MPALKLVELEDSDLSISENENPNDAASNLQSLLELKDAEPKDAIQIAEGLPQLQRAQIAKFCYSRVHLREMGLRIAKTCEMPALLRVFGSGAGAIFRQSRNVADTMEKLNHVKGQHSSKQITLHPVKT